MTDDVGLRSVKSALSHASMRDSLRLWKEQLKASKEGMGQRLSFRKRLTEKIATVVTIPEGGQHALVETKLFAGTRQHIHIFEI